MQSVADGVRATPGNLCWMRISRRHPSRASLRPLHRLGSHWPRSHMASGTGNLVGAAAASTSSSPSCGRSQSSEVHEHSWTLPLAQRGLSRPNPPPPPPPRPPPLLPPLPPLPPPPLPLLPPIAPRSRSVRCFSLAPDEVAVAPVGSSPSFDGRAAETAGRLSARSCRLLSTRRCVLHFRENFIAKSAFHLSHWIHVEISSFLSHLVLATFSLQRKAHEAGSKCKLSAPLGTAAELVIHLRKLFRDSRVGKESRRLRVVSALFGSTGT